MADQASHAEWGAQIHAEKSPFLVERLKVWMLPTLALVRKEQTVDYVVGFGDLGGKDDFSTEVCSSRSTCMTGLALMHCALHGPAMKLPAAVLQLSMQATFLACTGAGATTGSRRPSN